MSNQQDFEDLIARIEAATETLEADVTLINGGTSSIQDLVDQAEQAVLDAQAQANLAANQVTLAADQASISEGHADDAETAYQNALQLVQDLEAAVILQEAPTDGQQYARQDGGWSVVTGGGGGGPTFTTVGTNIAEMPDPSAVGFIRTNADNTVSARTAPQTRDDLGLGAFTSGPQRADISAGNTSIVKDRWQTQLGTSDGGFLRGYVGETDWQSGEDIYSYLMIARKRLAGEQVEGNGFSGTVHYSRGGTGTNHRNDVVDVNVSVGYDINYTTPPVVRSSSTNQIFRLVEVIYNEEIWYALERSEGSDTTVSVVGICKGPQEPFLVQDYDVSDVVVVHESVTPYNSGDVSADINTMLGSANNAAIRSNIGLGDAATQTMVTGTGDTTGTSVPTVEWVQANAPAAPPAPVWNPAGTDLHTFRNDVLRKIDAPADFADLVTAINNLGFQGGMKAARWNPSTDDSHPDFGTAADVEFCPQMNAAGTTIAAFTIWVRVTNGTNSGNTYYGYRSNNTPRAWVQFP